MRQPLHRMGRTGPASTLSRRDKSADVRPTSGVVSVATPASPAASGRDALRVAMFGVILFSQGRLHEHFSALGKVRPALLLVLFSLGLSLLQPSLLSRSKLLGTTPARAMAGLGIMGLASAALGISFGATATTILDSFWKTLLLGFLVVATIRNARDLVTFCWAMTAAAAFHVYLTTFVFSVSSAYGSATMRLDDMYMFDSNEVTCVLLAAVGVIGLIAQTSRGARRLAMIGVILGIGAAVARTGSRGGFLGLVAVGAMLLVVLRGVSFMHRIGIVIVASLGLVLYAPDGYWEQMRTILAPKADYNWSSEDGRRQIWSRGLSYMMAYPVAGVGIGNFSRAECMLGLKASQVRAGNAVTCTASHNSYVQAATEAGVPGLLLFVLLTVGGAVSLWRLGTRLPQRWLTADYDARVLYWAPRYLAISLIGFSVPAFFVSFAWHDLPFLLGGLSAGTITLINERLSLEGESR